MDGWCNDEQKEFTNRQICSINGFKLRTRPNENTSFMLSASLKNEILSLGINHVSSQRGDGNDNNKFSFSKNKLHSFFGLDLSTSNDENLKMEIKMSSTVQPAFFANLSNQ